MLPQTSKELLNYLIEGNTFAPDELEQLIRGHSDEDQYLDYKDGKITQRQNRNEASKSFENILVGLQTVTVGY